MYDGRYEETEERPQDEIQFENISSVTIVSALFQGAFLHILYTTSRHRQTGEDVEIQTKVITAESIQDYVIAPGL